MAKFRELGKLKKLGFERRKQLTGYAFIAPWFIGLCVLFMVPLVQSLIYSLSNLTIEVGHLNIQFQGFAQYIYAFTQDGTFSQPLLQSLWAIIIQTFYILILSVIVAVVINQKFIGRTAARAIFFLPVIVTSGIVISIINGDAMSSTIFSGEKASTMVKSVELSNLLLQSGMPPSITDFLIGIVNNIFNLTWKSGVQILLLLAGLQTIPPHLYEAGRMDGATAWESFWFITFPMITPILLLTTVYSIVDGLSDYQNPYQQKITDVISNNGNFSYGAALSWIYFAAAMLIVGTVFLIFRKRVFYETAD